MNYQLREVSLLRKILWADLLLGSTTAIPGLIWYRPVAMLLGLPEGRFLLIAAVTLGYAILAFVLACQRQPPVQPVRLLVVANWCWAAISIGLLVLDIRDATILGRIFLILQPVIVGGLGYLEGWHVTIVK